MDRGCDTASAVSAARVLHRGGDGRAALEVLERAIGFWPGDAGILAERALVRMDLGDASPALVDADRALAIDPEATIALIARAYFRASEDPAGALADATRAAEIDPGSPSVWYARAVLRGAFDGEGRRADLERAAACDRDDARSLYHRGLARIELGELEAGADLVESAVGAGMRIGDVFGTLGEAWRCLGRWQAAIAALDRGIEEAPRDAGLLVLRGWAKFDSGDRAGAFEDFSLATDLDPESVVARSMRAHSSPTARSMLDDLGRTARMEARDGLDLYHRGLARESLGSRRKAMLDYRQALSTGLDERIRREVEVRLAELEAGGVRAGLLRRPATALVLGITAAVWLFQGAAGEPPAVDVLVRHGALHRSLVWAGEVWRLVSWNFVHASGSHLAWTIGLGWIVLAKVERRLGAPRTVAAFLLAGVGAAAASMLARPFVAAGASGALFGSIAVLFHLRRRACRSWREFFEDSSAGSGVAIAAVWSLLGATESSVDFWAHVGGFLAGCLVGIPLVAVEDGATRRRTLAWGVALASIAAAAIVACRPGSEPASRAEVALEAARRAFEEGDAEEAVAQLTEAIRLHDQKAIVFARRGLARLELGDERGAKADLEEALRRDARCPLAHVGLAALAEQAGEERVAVGHYDRAIRLDPGNPWLYFHRGRLRRELGDLEGARTDLREALRLAPDDWPGREAAQDELARSGEV